MIDPRTQYILYQERQHELMAQIERRLAAQERSGAGGTGGAGETGGASFTGAAGNNHKAWYSAARQWLRQGLKEKLLYRGLAAVRPIAAGKSR